MTSSWIVWLAGLTLSATVARCWQHTNADALKSTLAAHDIALVACKCTTSDDKV